MSPMTVKLVDGNSIQCNMHIPACSWNYGDEQFQSHFRLLSLAHYDGILGLDWLASLGPMGVDWGKKWMTVHHKGHSVTFGGIPQPELGCFCSGSLCH